MVLPVIGNGARITACPIFNFAVRFVADNVRNDGVEIGCNDLYFFFFLILLQFIIIFVITRI